MIKYLLTVKVLLIILMNLEDKHNSFKQVADSPLDQLVASPLDHLDLLDSHLDHLQASLQDQCPLDQAAHSDLDHFSTNSKEEVPMADLLQLNTKHHQLTAHQLLPSPVEPQFTTLTDASPPTPLVSTYS